jgi:hypothetical protein
LIVSFAGFHISPCAPESSIFVSLPTFTEKTFFATLDPLAKPVPESNLIGDFPKGPINEI